MSILLAIASLNRAILAETDNHRRSALEEIQIKLMEIQRETTAAKEGQNYDEIVAECRSIFKSRCSLVEVVMHYRKRTNCGLKEAYDTVRSMNL